MQSFMNKTKAFLQRSYGVDAFNKFLLFSLFFLSILQVFMRNQILYIAYAALLAYMIFRMFSRNYGRRYQENQQYLKIERKVKQPIVNFIQQMKDLPKFKYFKCSKCKTKVRIPRKKGNVMITCPKCKNRFAGKS